MSSPPRTRPEWLRQHRLRDKARLLAGRVGAIEAPLPLGVNVTLATWPAAAVRVAIPEYEALPDAAKAQALRASTVEPLTVEQTHNTPTDDHAEQIVDVFDPNTTGATTVTHLALGDDDSTSPDEANTQLNNEFAQISVGSVSQSANVLETSTVLGTGEQNGNTIAEVGLRDGSTTSDLLFNHSLVGPEDKTNSKEITIDVDLRYIP